MRSLLIEKRRTERSWHLPDKSAIRCLKRQNRATRLSWRSWIALSGSLKGKESGYFTVQPARQCKQKCAFSTPSCYHTRNVCPKSASLSRMSATTTVPAYTSTVQRYVKIVSWPAWWLLYFAVDCSLKLPGGIEPHSQALTIQEDGSFGRHESWFKDQVGLLKANNVELFGELLQWRKDMLSQW